jgi:hypothetical protein
VKRHVRSETLPRWEWGERRGIVLLEGSQVSPAGPPDKSAVQCTNLLLALASTVSGPTGTHDDIFVRY